MLWNVSSPPARLLKSNGSQNTGSIRRAHVRVNLRRWGVETGSGGRQVCTGRGADRAQGERPGIYRVSCVRVQPFWGGTTWNTQIHELVTVRGSTVYAASPELAEQVELGGDNN